MKNKFKIKGIVIPVILAMVMFVTGCGAEDVANTNKPSSDNGEVSLEQSIGHHSKKAPAKNSGATDVAKVGKYKGKPYAVVNNNKPNFKKSQLTTKSYEKYSKLDRLGRCGVAMASVGRDIMPKEKRGAIGQVKPSGWHTVRYDDAIKDKYLYNRCHLIGYQLTGENANEQNLITGTRYLNVDGMLPFEDEVADYVKSTGNHVVYRVTPIFKGDNLVASGVQMEAMSVEDNGKGVCFNIYAYNVQPEIVIDYKTGESHHAGKSHQQSKNHHGKKHLSNSEGQYICNTNTKKYHRPDCTSVGKMSEHNKKRYRGKAQNLIDNGYSPCQNCNP